MEPLYFAESKELFGLYHPVQGSVSRGSVLICNPLFVDFYRTHQVVKETSNRLSKLGYDVLRFDLRGTGDSDIHSADVQLEDWLEDISCAVTELKELSGQIPTVIGIRLSAALALMALSEKQNEVANFVFWDPVLSGSKYIDELMEVQKAYAESYMLSHATNPVLKENEIVGFQCNSTLIESIATIDSTSAINNNYTDTTITIVNSKPATDEPIECPSVSTIQIDTDCDWKTMSGSLIVDRTVVERMIDAIAGK